jgi:uncharacterized RDD family membrane protein YckC
VGFWKRFVAFLIDSIIVLAVITPLLLFAHSQKDWELLATHLHNVVAQAQTGALRDPYSSPIVEKFSGPVDFLIQIALPVVALLVFWKFRSATPGKMAISARIVDARSGGPASTGQLALRFLGYFASILTAGIGFLMIALDPKKQGLHDKIAGTVVIYDED